MSWPSDRSSVLVVEDEGLIRLVLSEALMGAGFPVIEADSAEEALRALSGGRKIGAVVTDIRLPGSMDGIGLCRWMQEHTPDTPIIATTGFGDLEEAKKVNPAVIEVVAKPYPPEELAERVAELLRGILGLRPVPAPGEATLRQSRSYRRERPAR
jgi:DNA-binding NtrC family response regulator